jgi:hypothetical protein
MEQIDEGKERKAWRKMAKGSKRSRQRERGDMEREKKREINTF